MVNSNVKAKGLNSNTEMLLVRLLFPVLLQPDRRNQQAVDTRWDVPDRLRWPVSVSKNTLCSISLPVSLHVTSHVKWLILSLTATTDTNTTTRDGTTDITRTVHWGTPTAMQRVTLLIYHVQSANVWKRYLRSLSLNITRTHCSWSVEFLCFTPLCSLLLLINIFTR